MKAIKLFHNPGAGDEAFGKKDLLELISSQGFYCEYSSTKKGLSKQFGPHHDIIAVAGGDGTVRAVAKELLSRSMLDKSYPLALLPLGTANNIARTLGIDGDPAGIISRWKKENTRRFDIGRVYGIKKSPFFMESFGYGIFPYLMLEMARKRNRVEGAEESIRRALEVLRGILGKYEARNCRLLIDGEDYSGRYILAEIMNTQSIGPNLLLAPGNDVSDGRLEVVLVGAEDKDRFGEYVAGRIRGEEDRFTFRSIRAEEIEIAWDGRHVHVDDEIVRLKKNAPVRIEVRKGLLEFLV